MCSNFGIFSRYFNQETLLFALVAKKINVRKTNLMNHLITLSTFDDKCN